MDFALVDGANRRVGVGVGGQQGAFGVGEQRHRLAQERHPVHLRHPLVGQQQGDRRAALFEFVDGL